MLWDNWLFYDLYESKKGRELFLYKIWVWLDINRLIWDANYRIKQLRELNRLWKKSWKNREKYHELIYENLGKKFKD